MWENMNQKNFEYRRFSRYGSVNSYKFQTEIFIHTHLDYGVLSAQLNNAPFSEKIESIPYNGTLAITGGIKQTSRIKIYHKLELKKLNWTR